MPSLSIGSRVRVDGVAGAAVVQMETATQLLVSVEGKEQWVPRSRAIPVDDEVRARISLCDD